MDKRSSNQYSLYGKEVNSSNYSRNQPSNSRTHSAKKAPPKHNGNLEIIEGDASEMYSPDTRDLEDSSRPSSQGCQRSWSRSSMGSVPPRPDSSMSRRLATPTKQISLQAVRRKEESSEPFMPDVDFAALNLDKSYNRLWDFTSSNDEDCSRVATPKFDSESDLFVPQHATQLRLPRLHESDEGREQRLDDNTQDDAFEAGSSHSSLVVAKSNGRQEVSNNENIPVLSSSRQTRDDHNYEDGDDDDDEEDSDNEERKAPNELLMEFVECLMKKDYKNAEKLCKMILLYEPTNPEALNFQPVIEEKLKLEAEAQEGDEDEDEDNSEDEDDDDDDEEDEDDDSSSDDSDDDDDDDDDDDNDSIFRAMAEAVAANYYANQEPAQDQGVPRRRDSGIASDSEP
ncbi:hypothetical protein RRG08_064683 [Elysia crispata]|uniref:Glutamate-rich protein 2 n=1 Tax=Elysia crispata TaxID=231223 RepID=A0AAE0YGY1_9GAST|nr:hypothetical protein RRG08_064683 [Elysia crispata]